jgi:hypothetical protein
MRKVQCFLQVVDWLHNEGIRKERCGVCGLQNRDITNWTEPDVLEVEKVCHNFKFVG